MRKTVPPKPHVSNYRRGKEKSLKLGNRAQMEPGWHAWMSYLVDKAPNADPILKTGVRPWELKEHRPNPTMTRAAFKTYST